MRGLFGLLRLDATLAFRHRLVHVVVAMAAMFGGLLGFAVPDELGLQAHDYLVDSTRDGRFAGVLAQVAPERVLNDERALRQAVAADTNSLGIALRGSPAAPAALVITQGHESPERLALIRAGADALWQVGAELSAGPGVEIVTLEPGARKPPLGQSLVPLVFTLDVALLGFMFGAMMVLQEKESATIEAYRITPGGGLRWVLSKLLVNLGLVALNVLIVLALASPVHLLAWKIYALMLLCGAGMTLFGMGLAVYFRSLASFLYPMSAVSLFAALPMYIWLLPSVDLAWAWWLPTYHVLFATDAVMFRPQAFAAAEAFAYLAGFVVVAAGWAAVGVRRMLTEAR